MALLALLAPPLHADHHKGKITHSFLGLGKGARSSIVGEDGKVEWTGAFPKDRASYYSSPTIADGKIYAAREDGIVFVANFQDGFKLLTENDMGERIIASPVPVNGSLLIRGEKNLFCYRRK